MTVRLLALLLVCSALLAPASALAQSDPFGPVPQAPQPQAPPPAADDDEDEGLTRTQTVLIGLAAIALLVGIGWAIARDARQAAPGDVQEPFADTERGKGTKPPPSARVSTNRAKAKAARQARKRNKRRK